MNIARIIILAVGLSLDAFAVAVAVGATIRGSRLFQAFRVGVYFGGFQALMPPLGWLAGAAFGRLLGPLQSWLAFAILAAVGLKMIYESFRLEKAAGRENNYRRTVMLGLAVATSLDALAVGASFALLGTAVILPAAVIGAVAFLFSFAGVMGGEIFGHLGEKKLELLAGLILIGVALKILFESLGGL